MSSNSDSDYEYITDVSIVPRMFAFCIDFVIIILTASLLLLPVQILLELLGSVTLVNNTLLIQFTTIVTSFFYFSILEYYYMTSLGKKLYSIETISLKGKKLSFNQSQLRSAGKIHPLVAIIDLIMGFIINYRNQQRLTEKVSQTSLKKSNWLQKLTKEEQKTIRVFKIVLTIIGLFALSLLPLSLILNPILENYN